MKSVAVFFALVACAVGAAIESNGLADLLAAQGGINAFLDNRNRIVGGQETTIEQWPWIATMMYFGSHRCAASVVTANRFVSAAHCTVNIAAGNLQLRAGSTNNQVGGQLVQVASVINHPQYSGATLNNDVCVMWIGGSLTFGATVAPVPLHAQGASVATGATVHVAGWGALCEGCAGTNILRYVGKPYVPNSVCNANYGGGITDGMLCAGYPEGGYDACQGDSGGPLTFNGVLAGIVSWGNGCARPGFPGVYARVAFYNTWINENL